MIHNSYLDKLVDCAKTIVDFMLKNQGDLFRDGYFDCGTSI